VLLPNVHNYEQNYGELLLSSALNTCSIIVKGQQKKTSIRNTLYIMFLINFMEREQIKQWLQPMSLLNV
jgi:hypothetical protein